MCSTEKANVDSFITVGLGSLSNESISETTFKTYDELKCYLHNQPNSSVILILSNHISLDTMPLLDVPQICAIYNEDLVCQYCLPAMISSVDDYLQNKQSTNKKSKSNQTCISIVLPIIRKYLFILGLLPTILLAYFFPNIGKTGGLIRAEWTIKYGCVILIFFLSGLSLRTQQLVKELLRIRIHFVIQTFSLVILPLVIYAFALILAKTSINKILIFGIVIMGSTSTTMSSNIIMTKNALGNEYVAIINAVLGNVLGIFISPALLFFFIQNPTINFSLSLNDATDRISYGRTVGNLCLTVLMPLSIGQITRFLWPKQVDYIRERFYFSEVNTIALLLLLWSIFSTAFSNGSFQAVHRTDFAILILIDISIYICAACSIFTIARLPIRCWRFSEQDTIPISFCGSMKSLAMGILLINAFFGKKNQNMSGLLSLPLMMYHIIQIILGSINAVFLRNWIEKTLKRKSQKDNDILTSKTDKLPESIKSETIKLEP